MKINTEKKHKKKIREWIDSYLEDPATQKKLTKAINSLEGKEYDDVCKRLREFSIPKHRHQRT